VHLVERHVSVAERDAMLAACDCYVSLHRAEGFGLGLAETMGLGKPVIATGYSGNVDYMDDETAWLVPYTLREVGPRAAPYPPGAHWAEPDLDAAARAMREVVEHPEEGQLRGRRAAERIRARHSPEVAAAVIAGRLEVLRPRIEDRGVAVSEYRQARLDALMAPLRSRVVPPLHELLPGQSFRRRLRRRAIRAARPLRIRRQNRQRELVDAFEGLGVELLDRQDRAAAEMAGLYAAASAQLRRHDRLLEDLADRARAGDRAAAASDALRASVEELDRRLEPLEFGARAVPWMAGEPLQTFAHPDAGEVIGFRRPPGDGEAGYRLFEEVFRGPRDRVSELVAPYLPLLAEHGPVLDIGAGRGELLEALRDAGVEARGVDLDAGMAAGARAAGVEVEVADALDVLRSTPEAALGAITAMHVIEHLTAEQLDELLALARTRLRPGGRLIAETINPHAPHALKTFWVDPTHQHPVFPEVALIRAAAAGFGSAFVMHPRGERVIERDRFRQDAYALVAEA
jgi:SAM-dependent methyltransferase